MSRLKDIDPFTTNIFLYVPVVSTYIWGMSIYVSIFELGDVNIYGSFYVQKIWLRIFSRRNEVSKKDVYVQRVILTVNYSIKGNVHTTEHCKGYLIHSQRHKQRV